MGKKGKFKQSPPLSHQLHAIHKTNPITFYEEGIKELAIAKLKQVFDGSSESADHVESASDEEEDEDEHGGKEVDLELTAQDAEFFRKLDSFGERLAAITSKEGSSLVSSGTVKDTPMSESLGSRPPIIPKFIMELSHSCASFAVKTLGVVNLESDREEGDDVAASQRPDLADGGSKVSKGTDAKVQPSSKEGVPSEKYVCSVVSSTQALSEGEDGTPLVVHKFGNVDGLGSVGGQDLESRPTYGSEIGLDARLTKFDARMDREDVGSRINPNFSHETDSQVFSGNDLQSTTLNHASHSHDVPKTTEEMFKPINGQEREQYVQTIGTKSDLSFLFPKNPNGAQPQARVNACHVVTSNCPLDIKPNHVADRHNLLELGNASHRYVGPVDLSSTYEDNDRSMPINIGGALPYDLRLQQHDDVGRLSKDLNGLHHPVVPTAHLEECSSETLQRCSVEPINAHTASTAQCTLQGMASPGVGPRRLDEGMPSMHNSTSTVFAKLDGGGPGACRDHFVSDPSLSFLGSPKNGFLNKPLSSNGRVPSNKQTGSSWAELFKPAVQNHSGPDFHPGPNKNDVRFNSTSLVSQGVFDLEYVDHGVKEANLVLKIPKDLTIAGKEEWKATLVGRFLGKKLPYSLVTNVTDRFWSNDGLIDTLAMDSGYFFFTFSCVETRDAILEGGPWFVAGQPLLLRPWTPHFSFSNEVVHTIPIWVNFYGVPLEYWNPKGISFISSFIGKPIRVDRTTASRRRINYARVCIEINADFDFFKDFHIESKDEATGETLRTKISLEYQWTPVRCKQCSQFGHDYSRNAKPPSRPTAYYPNKRDGKVVGDWQVVTNKDKGKKIVGFNSLRPKDIVSSEAPVVRGNMFDALTQHMEETDSSPIKDASLAPSLARMPCLEASSSSTHHDEDRGEARGDPIGSTSVDTLDDCEVNYGPDGEIGPAPIGSPLSNRQKKKAAKMKFSGNRPKGRHRI